MTDRLAIELQYEWVPFKSGGSHLSFRNHQTARLMRSTSSWWGPAIYKWEGTVETGPNAGKQGILIGETGDLRQRIKQYVSGTQERGNKLWRESFLDLGSISLWVLRLDAFAVGGLLLDTNGLLASNNMRLVLEQLLVMKIVAQNDAHTWIVNARR